MKIAIVDYGLGNPLSIKNMLGRLQTEAVISSDPDVLKAADKLILPGVGHFASGMQNLNQSPLRSCLDTLVLEKKKPILGICLGMQLMTLHSSEGNADGLGWVQADTLKFDSENTSLKIPHMGWCDTFFKGNVIRDNEFEEQPPRFYYVHSYYVRCQNSKDILCEAVYGESFCSGFVSGNVMGVQFHPEKSHVFGKTFLKQFCEWEPENV